MTQQERQDFYLFIMNIPEIKENIDKINYIMLCGSKGIDIDDLESDYDVAINLKFERLIKNKYTYKNKVIDFFEYYENNMAWNNIDKFIYDINKDNLIFKDNDFDINYDKNSIKIIFNEFKKSLIIENDKVTAYKNSTLLLWLFVAYFHYIQDFTKKNFVLNYTKLSKPLIKADTLKEIEVLNILNSIKQLIETI